MSMITDRRKFIRSMAIVIFAVFTISCMLQAMGIVGPEGTATTMFGSTYPKTSYVEFKDNLDKNLISEACIEEKLIQYTTKEGTFITDNPSNPNLKEQLLLKGVKVTERSGSSINGVMDMIFNLIFFALVGFGIFKLADYSRKTFHVVRKTGVSFDDIAGMDEVKSEMMFLVDVLKNPQQYASKGIRPIKGVVLEGPPGNGKTLFAKALAQQADVNFIATKGADFQSAFMSMGARKIKMLFSKAARHKPCIVFIDEFDSIGERRNYAGTGIDKENNRIITTMLNEMDGFTANNGLLVIAATNSYQSLDPALVRPGRFDIKYTIGNPDLRTRRRLAEIYTADKTMSEDLTTDAIAAVTEGLSCAAVEALLNEASSIAAMAGKTTVTAEHILAAASKTGCRLNIKKK